jgi:hypothetical protein
VLHGVSLHGIDLGRDSAGFVGAGDASVRPQGPPGQVAMAAVAGMSFAASGGSGRWRRGGTRRGHRMVLERGERRVSMSGPISATRIAPSGPRPSPCPTVPKVRQRPMSSPSYPISRDMTWRPRSAIRLTSCAPRRGRSSKARTDKTHRAPKKPKRHGNQDSTAHTGRGFPAGRRPIGATRRRIPASAAPAAG